MGPGARSKFGAPLFERKLFRKQMYCIEESARDIVGSFQRPPSDRAPGELYPLAPLVTSLAAVFLHRSFAP